MKSPVEDRPNGRPAGRRPAWTEDPLTWLLVFVCLLIVFTIVLKSG